MAKILSSKKLAAALAALLIFLAAPTFAEEALVKAVPVPDLSKLPADKAKQIRDAFRGSTKVVRGHWWRTLRIAGFFWLLSVVAGPVLGFALIFANLSLTWINIIGSLVFALLVPYVAIGRTLLYFDLQAREEGAQELGRRRRWSRARPSPQPG